MDSDLIRLLVVAVMLSASLTILAAYGWRARPRLFQFFKPLSTVLILIIALVPGPMLPDRYAGGIRLGLIFSLVGDILLMLPGDLFRQGLAAFLLARLCYAFAFFPGAAASSFAWWMLALSIIGLGSLMYLWPSLGGGLRAAISVYVAVTVFMTALPAAYALSFPSAATFSAAVGALLFMLSDLLLAIDRFRRPFSLAHGLVLATYYAGQLLIALSVGLWA